MASMQSRGMAPSVAMDLFNQIGIIAYGGAIESMRQREFEFQDETMDVVARRQFGRLDPTDFPLLADVIGQFTETPEQKTDSIMRSVFANFAGKMGEDETQLFKEA